MQKINVLWAASEDLKPRIEPICAQASNAEVLVTSQLVFGLGTNRVDPLTLCIDNYPDILVYAGTYTFGGDDLKRIEAITRLLPRISIIVWWTELPKLELLRELMHVGCRGVYSTEQPPEELLADSDSSMRSTPSVVCAVALRLMWQLPSRAEPPARWWHRGYVRLTGCTPVS